MRRALLLVAVLLVGCGGDGDSDTAARSSPAVDPDIVEAADDLCAELCAALEGQADACPGIVQSPPDVFVGAGLAGADFPRTCDIDLAHGIEMVHAVRDGILDVAPAADQRLPDLFAAIGYADDAYTQFQAGTGCFGVGLAPEYAAAGELAACAEAVRESIRWQPIVAQELRSLTS